MVPPTGLIWAVGLSYVSAFGFIVLFFAALAGSLPGVYLGLALMVVPWLVAFMLEKLAEWRKQFSPENRRDTLIRMGCGWSYVLITVLGGWKLFMFLLQHQAHATKAQAEEALTWALLGVLVFMFAIAAIFKQVQKRHPKVFWEDE